MILHDYHGFPSAVDSFGGYGKVTTFVNGDKTPITNVSVSGNYLGENGVFEYYIEPSGRINHRFFRTNK